MTSKHASIAHAAIPAAIGAASFGWKSGLKNLGEYLSIMNLDKFRNFIGGQGNAIARAGFRDALRGKRVSRYGAVGLGTGVAAGAAPMSLYEQGHDLGKSLSSVSKASGIDPWKLLKGIQKGDKGLQAAISTAPYSGAAVGAARGVAQERNKRPEDRRYLNSGITGAVKGGLLGAGVKRFLPHAAGVRHLHDLRTGQVDQLLGDGKMKTVEKMFGRAARPEVAAAAKRNVAAEGFEAGMHGKKPKGVLFGHAARGQRREGVEAGKKFKERASKVPFVTPEQAQRAVPKADDLLRSTLRRAPLLGAGAGAAADVVSERHKRPERRNYARAAGMGALKGGALGAAVGHFAPHTKAVKDLHAYREKFFQ